VVEQKQIAETFARGNLSVCPATSVTTSSAVMA